MPNWCTAEVYQKLDEFTAEIFDIFAHTNSMMKIAVGPTIKRFIKNIKESESTSNRKKIYLYSAHDFNVITFIRAHNLTTPRLAEYGSSIIFEKLRGKDNRIYIRVS